MDFVDAVKTMELLPIAWIPAMIVQPRMPTPAASQPVIGMERLKPRAKKPVGLPHDVIMAERGGSDMEVEDLMPIVPVDKGKRRADAGPAPKWTRRGTVTVSDVEGVSLKRDLQDSPSRPDPVAKRQRVIEGLVPGGLDFSGLQVKEFDLVSEDQIAGVTAKVRCPEVPDDSQADYSRSPAATVSPKRRPPVEPSGASTIKLG